MTQVNCSGVDPEFFFPSNMQNAEEISMYKRMCSTCPGQQKCLEWGLRHEEYGMWGGLTQIEIRKLRRQKKIPLKSVTFESLFGRMVPIEQ